MLLFITEWDQFSALDMSRITMVLKKPNVIVRRNINWP
jgi:UDP-glucose 6-dehydrogenase